MEETVTTLTRRRLGPGMLLAALAFSLAACGSPDSESDDSCGPQKSCPQGFTCDPVARRCIRTAELIDAPGAVPDAAAPDAAAPDAAVIDAAPRADAAAAPDGPLGAALQIAPASLDLGAVATGGASSPMTVTVSNAGGAATGILSASVSDAESFGVAGAGRVGQPLQPGTSCTLSVIFHPVGMTGPRTATLAVSGAPGGTVTVALGGDAVAPVALGLSLTSVAFGAVAVTTESASVTITLNNTGDVAAEQLALTLDDVERFEIVSTTCGATLLAAASCLIELRFTPQAVGAAAGELVVSAVGGEVKASLAGTGTAELTVTVSGSGGGSVSSEPAGITACATSCSAEFTVSSVSLTATPDAQSGFVSWSGGGCGAQNPCTLTLSAAQTVTATFAADPPTLLVSPTFKDFGGVDLGGTSSVTTFVVTNDGGSPSGILSAEVDDPVSFTVTGGTCLGATLPAGDVCSVLVQFNPTGQVGSRQATLTVTGAGTGASGTASLTGTATALLHIDKQGAGTGTVTSTPAGISCGAVCSASFSSSVSLAAAAGPYSVFSGWSGGGCEGTGACNVSLSTETTVTATFDKTPAQLSIAPGSHDFATTVAATQSEAFEFVVTNLGGQASTALIASLSDVENFTIVGGTCVSLSSLAGGGGTCTLDVALEPVTHDGALGATIDLGATLEVSATAGGTTSAVLTGSTRCLVYAEAGCTTTSNCCLTCNDTFCASPPCTSGRCAYP